MNPMRKTLAVGAMAGITAAAALVGSSLVQNVQFARARDEVTNSREQLSTVTDLSKVFRNVGKVVEPSVVNLSVQKSGRTPPIDEDALRRFFPDRDGDGEPDLPPGFGGGGGPDDRQFEQQGTGSGVIMEFQGGSGFILTNNHVVGGATELTVTLADGRAIKNAKVVGTDPKTDLAVVKIEADRLIPAKWGDSDELARGDWVMAFGSPFGYVGSMTHGIVSALNRQAGVMSDRQSYENFIQVDAPINPGNSGGPLTNVQGEVVGINTAIASRSGGFQGVGFAIPSNQAKFVYSALKDKGKVTRGWLGVAIDDAAKHPGLVKSFGYQGDKGVLVQQTFSDTPATGKLREGDIITEMNGKPAETVQQLRNAVASTAPGQDLKLKVFRDGQATDVTVKIGEQPEDLSAMGSRTPRPAPPAKQERADKAIESLGLSLSDVTDAAIQQFSLSDVKSGAVITKVAPKSPAAKALLRVGDVIAKVGDKTVANAEEATAALAKADVSKGVRLYVTTPGGSRFAFIEAEAK